MNILILSKGGQNYTTKRLKEVAIEHGHDVRIRSYTKCYLAIEKGNPVVYYGGEKLTDVDAIIPRIAQRYTRYGSAVVRQFEMQGVFTTASSIAIARSRDKLRANQILARQGIGVPKTVIASETTSDDEVIDLVDGPPAIIKLASGTHGRGVVLAESRKAAQAVMQAFFVGGLSFMVQEFIQESAGQDIRALVVGGRVVASIKRQNLDEDFRSNTHLGAVGSPIKLTDEEKKTVIKAAKAMGLPICGVDMIRSERGPLVLEVNSSASIKTPESVTGRDVAEKIIEYIELNAKRRQKKDRVGA